jgi:hypothetical protein
MDWYLVSVLIFIAVLAVIFYRDRKNVERQSIMLIRRTQRTKNSLIRLGRRFPRFWKVVGVIGVVFGFCVSVWLIYILIDQTIMLFSEKLEIGAGILIPSLSNEASIGPGYFAVPFWYWIISIALLVVVHEGMHGIMAAREKIRIKSLGWGLLAIIPLAFVEPDEKQLSKQKPWKQLRVFAAGSFANFCLAGVSILIVTIMGLSLFTGIGVGYGGTMDGFPANVSGMPVPGIITGINDYDIRDLNDLDVTLKTIGPNQTIIVNAKIVIDGEITDQAYVMQTVCDPHEAVCDDGFIGVLFNPSTANIRELNAGLAMFEGAISFIMGLFLFVFLINFLVGAFNLLPIGPLDGGRMYSIFLDRVIPKHSKIIMRGLSWFVLFLILINFIMPFVNMML